MKLYDSQDVLNAIATLEGKGIPWVCEIKRDCQKRTNQQNRLYWGNISIIAEYTGNTPEEIHALVKDKFLTKKRVIKMGKRKRTVYIENSTTTLDTKEFKELMERVYAIGESLNCTMIYPEDPLPEYKG